MRPIVAATTIAHMGKNYAKEITKAS